MYGETPRDAPAVADALMCNFHGVDRPAQPSIPHTRLEERQVMTSQDPVFHNMYIYDGIIHIYYIYTHTTTCVYIYIYVQIK